MYLKNIAGIVVLTIIVGSFAVPAIYDTVTDHDYYVDNAWRYDDYKKAPNVSNASGALELITISETEYLHAKDVGAATITYENGSTEDVTVSKANLDIIVALGQSNNAYAEADPSAAICPEIGMAYYYGTATQPIVGSNSYLDGDMYPMVTTPGTPVIGDKAPPFCAQYCAHTYHKVYYINGSWPGRSITTWQPGETSYVAAQTNIANAMAAVDLDKYNVSSKGYTWIQGEHDGNMPAMTYYDYFLTMHESILSGGLGIDLDHCFLSKVKNTYAGSANAQMLLAKNIDTITMSTEIADTFTIADGMLASDGIHYLQKADNLIGTALGKSAANFYYPPVIEDNEYTNLILVLPAIFVIAIVLVAVRIVRGND